MKGQNVPLFDVETKWQEEWKDMPEFNMQRIKPILTIKINFRSEKDIEEFSKLIGQKITKRIWNYWYPKLNVTTVSDMVYADKEDES